MSELKPLPGKIVIEMTRHDVRHEARREFRKQMRKVERKLARHDKHYWFRYVIRAITYDPNLKDKS